MSETIILGKYKANYPHDNCPYCNHLRWKMSNSDFDYSENSTPLIWNYPVMICAWCGILFGAYDGQVWLPGKYKRMLLYEEYKISTEENKKLIMVKLLKNE